MVKTSHIEVILTVTFELYTGVRNRSPVLSVIRSFHGKLASSYTTR